MAGETVTATAHPRPWACPTPDLDLSDVEWTAYEIKSGTTYHDEPSVEIDPGWYVSGFLPEHDSRDAPPITIKIEGAYDEHGCDRAQHLAQRLTGALARESDAERRWPPRAEPKPSRLRRFANGCADVIGTLIREVR